MIKKSYITKVLLLTGMLSVFCFWPSFSVQAIEYGGIGLRPAYPRADNPSTKSIFIHSLNLGATQLDGVMVINNTSERKTMTIYASDSTPSTDGAFACKQFSEKKNDVGAWVTLSQSEVTLDPGTNEIIPFTINVPQNVSVGEHNGCILIQEKKASVEGQTGASISIRTGVRVVTTIPGDIRRELEIFGFKITKSKDGFVLHPLIKNTGNVSIDSVVQVQTRYFFGLIFDVDEEQHSVLPGETSALNIELKKPFWGGWYRSDFSVEYDQNAKANIGIKSSDTKIKLPNNSFGTVFSKITNSSLWFFSFPTPLALVIEIIFILLICSGGLLLRFYKRRKKEKQSKLG